MSARQTILLVDDDESTREYLSLLLAARGYAVVAAASGPEALEHLRTGPAPAAILVDMLMPGMDGLAFIEEARANGSRAPAIVISAIDKIRTVVDAMNRGAADYLTKPFEEPELDLAIQNALEKQRLREEVSQLRARLADVEPAADALGASPSMQRLREIARQIADTDAPVLLLGETGVGKEVLARYIHAQSARADKPLVRVNCAALPHDLLESELFGHERGAFSGALQAKPGKFEQAHGGSLLLDEITEMGPALQAKLLHVLQDGEFTRLGGRQPLRADARVLAASNRNLERAVADGSFREDVYFRLNVVRMEVPPLRERREDIPLLCETFLRRYAGRYRRPGRPLPPQLIEAFLRHDWPGNVRELENAVRRFVILPDLALALAELRQPGAPPAPAAALAPPPASGGLASLRGVGAAAADSAERDLVARVLAETRWNRREAARRLRISYKALLNRIKRWSLADAAPAAPPADAAPTEAPDPRGAKAKTTAS
ncbi:MAG: sigma-54-dependent transcriptional regulator [Vicinamibacteria bacterium]